MGETSAWKRETNGSAEKVILKPSFGEATLIEKKKDLADYPELKGLLLKGVRMGEAAIFEPSGKAEALYTDNAFSCAILVLIARNKETDKISGIALAHVDGYNSSIPVLFDLLRNGTDVKFDAYAIGGDWNFRYWVEAAIRKEKDTKLYSVCSQCDGEKSKAAAVDSNGKIYFARGSTFPEESYITDLKNAKIFGSNGALDIIDLRIPKAIFPDVYPSDISDLLRARMELAEYLGSTRLLEGMEKVMELPENLKKDLQGAKNRVTMELELKKARGKALRIKISGLNEFGQNAKKGAPFALAHKTPSHVQRKQPRS